jgi:molecular chaperone DnaJ
MNLDFDPTIDFYKALGVPSTATQGEIKKAYRKLAVQNHPDSTGGDKAKESRFKDISAAYDVLGDVKKRAQYDEVRAMGGGRPRARGPGGVRGNAGGEPVWDLGDLFSQMFAGQAAQAGPSGARRSVRFNTGGGGWDPEPAPQPPAETKTRAADGSMLSVTGQDVHSDVRVPFDHAILGTVVEVATIDGTSSVKIPPGTGSGKKLRLRGKGLPGPGGQGDHYVTIQIDVPAQLDDRAKQLLVELTQHLQAAARRK